MLLIDVVETSTAVAATRARTAKTAAVAALLERARSEADPLVVAALSSWLGGAPRQRRTGIGWRTVADLPAPAPHPSLTVRRVDELLEEAASLAGSGTQSRRNAVVTALFGAATTLEQDWLRSLLLGNLRQGALDSAVQAALAQVAGVPVDLVRRASMLAGATTPVAQAALMATTPAAASAALRAITLEVGRGVQPMLASSAPSVREAVASLTSAADEPVLVDTKLDGIRLQVHRRDGVVRTLTRSLDDITARLPEVVRLVQGLPAGDLVLDAEVLLIDADGHPLPFQDTSSRTGSQSLHASSPPVHPYFFDVLHHDGRDLVDVPLAQRLERLAQLVPSAHRTPSLVTADPDEAERFARAAWDAGHEGVVVKDLRSPYAAGRRGAAWIKVKPVHTVDLVVLAVEHGSGRRAAWLSTLHLGARDESTGEFVMVGKTFKGMTDEMLAWQTERFSHLQISDDGHVVQVRPEQVVEIAADGIQRSTRYPGGVALRFARVVRYRTDKSPDQIDTLETVRALGPRREQAT